MQPKKPKSAPAGRLTQVQSRLQKNQSDAVKEMKAWARKSDEPSTSCHVTRMSGQLSDNVTEERMLRARLWELSKERYKFLMQNAYEKKLFADRMQRRTQAMLKARANSAATVRASARVKPRPLTTSAIATNHSAPNHPSSSCCQSNIPGTHGQARPGTLGTKDQMRPGTQGTLGQLRPGSLVTNSQVRPGTLGMNGQVRPGTQGTNSQLRPCALGTHAQIRPGSMGTNGQVRSGAPGTSSRSPLGPVSLSWSKNEEGVAGNDLLHPPFCSTPHRDTDPCDRAVDVDTRSGENVGQQSAVSPGGIPNNASLEDRDKMREVERRWATSAGREKVTPAATIISIPPPGVPYFDNRMALAPLHHVRVTPAAAWQDSDPQAKPSSSPLPPAPAMPRNAQFSQTLARPSTGVRTTLIRSQTQTGAFGQMAPKVGVPPSRNSSAKQPSKPTVSSKPTSASSQKSKTWTTPNASTAPGSSSLTTRFAGSKGGSTRRYGLRAESKTSDPRYASLERSLNPVPPSRAHADVSTIVQSCDALHVRPKVCKEVKSKTGIKALSYITERGFVF